MTVTSWDDYPVHQSSNWIAHSATSDRNFYDRYYFNAFDTGGEWIAIMGLGQYPNLGRHRRVRDRPGRRGAARRARVTAAR